MQHQVDAALRQLAGPLQSKRLIGPAGHLAGMWQGAPTSCNTTTLNCSLHACMQASHGTALTALQAKQRCTTCATLLPSLPPQLPTCSLARRSEKRLGHARGKSKRATLENTTAICPGEKRDTNGNLPQNACPHAGTPH